VKPEKEKVRSAEGGEKKGGAKKTAPQARKKEIKNANRKSLVGHYRARGARVSRRDFLQNKFGFYPRPTANCQNQSFG